MPDPLDMLRTIAQEQRAALPAIEPTRFGNAQKFAAAIPISTELLEDYYDIPLADMFAETFAAQEQRRVDRAKVEAWGLTPLEHRPGRDEWRKVTRPDRVRRNIRANLGMRPGQTARMVRSADQGG